MLISQPLFNKKYATHTGSFLILYFCILKKKILNLDNAYVAKRHMAGLA
jgi:hypothetical protein